MAAAAEAVGGKKRKETPDDAKCLYCVVMRGTLKPEVGSVAGPYSREEACVARQDLFEISLQRQQEYERANPGKPKPLMPSITVHKLWQKPFTQLPPPE